MNVLPLDAGGVGDAFAQEPDAAWHGVWESADGRVLLLEAGRCARATPGEKEARFYRTHPREGGLLLERWGRLERLSFALEGETLVIHGEGDEALRYQRRGEAPEMLTVPAYSVLDPLTCDADLTEMIQTELAEREAEDQRVRRAAMSGGGLEIDSEAYEDMRAVDEANTAFLVDLVQRLGWIDATRFGTPTSEAAFLIAQHSGDLRLMRTALAGVEPDVQAGRMPGGTFALLHDRLQLNLGYDQRYGSQLATLAGGRNVLMPLEDREKVDDLRGELGMQPLADYLAYFADGEEAVVHLADVLEELEDEAFSASGIDGR